MFCLFPSVHFFLTQTFSGATSYIPMDGTVFRNMSAVQCFSFIEISVVIIQCLFSKYTYFSNNNNYLFQLD